VIDAEALRHRFRPDQVRVLFIGESAPAGGTFFYAMNSLLYAATQDAFRQAVPSLLSQQNFLRSFQHLGCYLVDLCDRPVNRLADDDRLAARDDGVRSLADLVRVERPPIVITVMREIAPWVDGALRMAEYEPARRFDLPFPRRQHARRYVELLATALGSVHEEGLLVAS
jgi:hypothetical protein